MDEKMKQLYQDLPEEAIQRTKSADTKKGYDTTGYGYQYLVDVFNDVYGTNWGYSWEVMEVKQGQFSNGTPFFDITVRLGIWIEKPENTRELAGGHVSRTFGDALKGAITNGFKKTSAMWGVGSKAYRGNIDDDNEPRSEEGPLYQNKLDYNVVDKELSECKTEEEIDSYSRILIKEYPDMSQKQKEIVKSKFAKRRAEIKAVNEDNQVKAFDDLPSSLSDL
jgi:hypothetical protein